MCQTTQAAQQRPALALRPRAFVRYKEGMTDDGERIDRVSGGTEPAAPDALGELAAQRDLYAAFVEGAPDAMVVTSPDGIIQYANPAAEALVDCERGALVGRSMMDLVDQQDLARRPVNRARVDAGETAYNQRRLLRRDHEGVWVETATRKLADLQQRAADLAERLKGELTESQNARGRVDAGVEAISSAIRQVRADREMWEAQGRAAEARNEAAVQELRRALADDRARVAALEAANKRLLEAHATLEERLAVLEKKKVFGLF